MPLALPSGELTSTHIVDSLDWEIAARAFRFEEVTGRKAGLSIVNDNEGNAGSQQYMGMKVNHGTRLGLHVVSATFESFDAMLDRIDEHNEDPAIDGIVPQLPTADTDNMLTAIDRVTQSKDVDGLREDSLAIGATALGIGWWLRGNNIPYLDPDQRVVVLGKGLAAGGAFLKHATDQGANVQGFDKADCESDPLKAIEAVNEATIVVTAMGKAHALVPGLFLPDGGWKAVADCGTAELSGAVHGDMSDELRAYALEQGWAITPHKRGIGPLTVRMLMSNTLDAAERSAGITEPIDYRGLHVVMMATTSKRRPPITAADDDRAMRELLMMYG